MSESHRAALESGPAGAASLLGIPIRGGRARRFPSGRPSGDADAASATGVPDLSAEKARAEVPSEAPMDRSLGSAPAPEYPETMQGEPGPEVAASGQGTESQGRLRAPGQAGSLGLQVVPPVPIPVAPTSTALVAMWRSWRTGGGLPALAKVEGRMAELCPGGILLAVARDRIEVAQRLPGEAPDLDLAALDWMRAVALEAARSRLARHELDEEARLGLLALPFALDGTGAPGSDIASAVLCRIYALEAADARDPGSGFFSGVFRRLAGA